MLKNIVVIGCDGYIGTALVQRLLNKQIYNILGIDNLSRRFFVAEEKSRSATPILNVKQKYNLFSIP